MTHAATLAARLAALDEISEPWPHCIADDFLPLDLFADLLMSLPMWKRQDKTKDIFPAVKAVLTAAEVEDAIRLRFGFEKHRPEIDLTFRINCLGPHVDRQDKAWSGIIYLAGDMTQGTDFYDAGKRLVKRVEAKPNRLLCWNRRGEQHSVPKGNGRFAIQWWFLK